MLHAGCTQAVNMFRLTGTVYTFGFLLMTLKYFFSGPPDKSNRARQRARLVHAYMVTLFALLCPLLVSKLGCCCVWLVSRVAAAVSARVASADLAHSSQQAAVARCNLEIACCWCQHMDANRLRCMHAMSHGAQRLSAAGIRYSCTASWCFSACRLMGWCTN